MIYLTGDVHSMNLNAWENKKVKSQIDSAQSYLKILKKYNLPCTLFINGVCLEKDSEQVKKLLEFDIELGGHTYDNFGKMGKIRGYIYRKVYGCLYGSERFQKKDIKKTKKAFERLGLKMLSWRTHAFGSNEKTFKLLKEQGVKFVSDLTGSIKPFKDKNNLIHLPINIPVDNNTIAYGKFSPENQDVFASCTKGRISPEEWFEIIKKRVQNNEKNRINSIILIHPITMQVLDNFKLFEKIAGFLSNYESAKFSEFRD